MQRRYRMVSWDHKSRDPSKLATASSQTNKHHQSKPISAPDITSSVIAIATGSVAGAVVLLALFYFGYRIYRNRKAKLGGEYEKILSTQKLTAQGQGDPKSVVTAPVSMKTIPFTVPPSASSTCTPPLSRRPDNRSWDENNLGNGSEPSSPLYAGRAPLDNAGSTEFRGAYALGSIDPSLYKMVDEDDNIVYPDDNIGRIWFAVEYERESEKLLVNLIKAKNLPSRVLGNVNGCDPFVRIYLMPDERRYLQSKFRKKTCNPKFEESFVFQVSYKAIQERVLKLTVFDVDRHKRHNVVGHALYPLKEHDYDNNERVVIWRDLEREVSECTADQGEIHVALSYNNNLERLTVGIFEAKNLKKSDANPTADYYVKVCLLIQNKLVKSKRTETVKRAVNPMFNESFTFRLPMSNLDTASVAITTTQHVSGHKDRLIGRVVLGSFMFARGKELEHWNEMVANQREQVCHWHLLT